MPVFHAKFPFKALVSEDDRKRFSSRWLKPMNTWQQTVFLVAAAAAALVEFVLGNLLNVEVYP
jgi:hypothetical protein